MAEDFLFSMAMISNSNVAVASGAGPARRQAAGTLVPRPRGLVSGLKTSLNPRTGKYAAEARAFMREQGLSCYKMMTPGSTRAKEVMEMLHSNYAEAGFTADPRVLRLLDREGGEQGTREGGTAAQCVRVHIQVLSHHPTPHKFVGFRYIDDLLVFYKDDTTPGNSATKQEITGIYPQPLELEEEDINNGTLRYLEHWIAFSANGDLGVQHYHKNSHRIREGKPPLKNVVDHSSFTPCGYQFGRIVGAMHRIVNSSIGHHNITQGCIVMLNELIHQMQFPKTLIKQAIQHMIATVPQHQSAWGALAIYCTHSR